MATREKKSKIPQPEVLEIHYSLGELPSSQHRAGLAGLVLMVEWMKQQSLGEGICEVERSTYGATLRINQKGLEELFNELYSASNEEQERDQPLKNKKTKQIIPPLREEVRQITDSKNGKVKEKTIYIYSVTIPKGSFLLSYDPTSDDRNGLWIKLWRDCIWSIFRGVPATRGPFEDRANGLQTSDAEKVWHDLIKPHDHTVQLPSTYFVGAQANNADNVSFLDRARFQFLLHFWPYVAQIYVPAYFNNKDEVKLTGYAIAIPDIANLDRFCDEFPRVMNSRTHNPYRRGKYLPEDCVIDLVVEGALDTFGKFQQRLKSVMGSLELEDLLLGIDVVHLEKQGNSIKLLNSIRLDPESEMVDQYSKYRNVFWNQHFRRQRLLNLLNPTNNWYTGFDSLFARLPFKQTIGDNNFRRDVRLIFEEELKFMNGKDERSSEQQESENVTISPPLTDQELVYRTVSNYLWRKLDSKYNLTWKAVKSNPRQEAEFNEKKAKLAREAFLAIRSRTGQDFIEYFVSTLCSVSQSMNEQRYVALTDALMNETDNIRTLTLLALAAQTPWSQQKSDESEA
jgi:CRISPR-associated protein Cmx8